MTANCNPIATLRPVRTQSTLRVYAAAILIFIPCLAATTYFCRTMSGGMPMPGGWMMSMMWMPMAGQTWLESVLMFMLMWIAMMVTMMLPSSLPMIFRYHHERQSANSRGASLSTVLMMIGYFFVWGAAGLLAYLPGVLLALAAMRWTALSHAVPFLLGAAIMFAGALQFSPWKAYALSRCRGPFSCVNLHSHKTLFAAWLEGVNCGLCCVTCCFGPTLILLALGMMNPVVIVMVAGLIALEKLLPEPKFVSGAIGIGAIAMGIAIIGGLALAA
jgi:predicted metal-binding membrane protein